MHVSYSLHVVLDGDAASSRLAETTVPPAAGDAASSRATALPAAGDAGSQDAHILNGEWLIDPAFWLVLCLRVCGPAF
jgi:hypothetical protein